MFSGALARSELDLQDMARRGGVVLAFPDAEGLVWNDGSLSQACRAHSRRWTMTSPSLTH